MFKVFFVTMAFFFLLSMAVTIHRHAPMAAIDQKDSVREQVQEIDQEIQELRDVKRGFEAKAIRHENFGEMQQSRSEYTLETRRHYQLAEQNREIADQIQQDIDRLEVKKQKLLKNI